MEPIAIIIVAGIELIVLSLVTALYYYEAIRGLIQGNPALTRQAERMFALGSGLIVLNFLALGLPLWFPEVGWVTGLAKITVTGLLLICAGCCLCWALGGLLDPGWYFIPWKSSGSGDGAGQQSVPRA